MVGQTANYNGSYKMEPGMGMGHHHHDHINSHHHHESKNIGANSKKLFFALYTEFHLVKLIFEMLFKVEFWQMYHVKFVVIIQVASITAYSHVMGKNLGLLYLDLIENMTYLVGGKNTDQNLKKKYFLTC